MAHAEPHPVNACSLRLDSAHEMHLANGGTCVIRALVAGDRPAVAALFDAMADDNVYLRAFTFGERGVSQHLDRVFAAGPGSMAFVLELRGTVAGIVDVQPVNARSAEIAFAVTDGAHGMGIGTLLLEHAAAEALAMGFDWLVADAPAVNHAMLDTLEWTGPGSETLADAEGAPVRISTTAGSTELAASRARFERARTNAHPEGT
jgi:GNAT superfamily N-acetyltransferase